MEEILIIVLQILLELGLELMFWVGTDFMAWWSFPREKPGSVGCVTEFLIVMVGAGVGLLMNMIYPRPVLPYDWLRMINLIAGPLLAGWTGWLFADWRRRRGAQVIPKFHFWIGFWFVLAFDLVRFIYAKRDFFV
jgi:hypothetical protein